MPPRQNNHAVPFDFPQQFWFLSFPRFSSSPSIKPQTAFSVYHLRRKNTRGKDTAGQSRHFLEPTFSLEVQGNAISKQNVPCESQTAPIASAADPANRKSSLQRPSTNESYFFMKVIYKQARTDLLPKNTTCTSVQKSTLKIQKADAVQSSFLPSNAR